MKKLFEPAFVGGLSLRNRLIRSATYEYGADAAGHYTPVFDQIYRDLAQGGVGAIITGMVGVDETSRLTPKMVKAYDEAFVPGLRHLADLVHEQDCKLVVQLAHCGVKSAQLDQGGQALGPSDTAEAFPPAQAPARSMRRAEIAALAQSFAAAALRCRQAGADAVQLHCAHGYLISQFLSPYFNRRTDEYGGDITGRSRIVREVYAAVRQAVGADFPVWIKINCADFTEPGSSGEEYFQVCAELSALGLDAIELSCGLGLGAASSAARPLRSEADEAPLAAAALDLARRVPCSVVSVCGHRHPGRIEALLQQGGLAAVSLCRPLISEPDLPLRWQAGDQRPPRCISCNRCFKSKGALSCVLSLS